MQPPKPKMDPVTMAELLTKVVVTPDASNSLLSDLATKYNVQPEHVHTTKARMSQKMPKRALMRAHLMRRRSK